MVDKTPQQAMAGTASDAAGWEIMVFDRSAEQRVNSIPATAFFGPNPYQAAHGNHSHVTASSIAPGFMSTSDKIKMDQLVVARQIPAGGSTGQILTKAGAADFVTSWANPPVGEGGGLTTVWTTFGTSASLASTNAVIGANLLGLETDTIRWKIGDGASAWTSLPYQDTPRTPAAINNPGAGVTFGFRPGTTQTISFSSPPTGTVTIQAPSNGPTAGHEGEMFFHIINSCGVPVEINTSSFILRGDYIITTIADGDTAEYLIWYQGGTWYIAGEIDIPDGSVGNLQLADMTANRIKGRQPGTDGAPEDLTPNQVKWMLDNAQPSIVAVGVNTTLTKALHQGKYLVCSAAVNLTVDAATDFDQHYMTTIRAEGGAVTVIATTTVNAPSGLIIPQYATGILRRMAATDTYSLEIASHPKTAAANSVVASTASGTTTLSLSGDVAAPGNNFVYGTGPTGVKGWKADPAGGAATNLAALTDVADTLAGVEGHVLTFTSGEWRNGVYVPPGGAGTAVASMADLQAIAAPEANQLVTVMGYSAAHDGGHGQFIWDASVSDDKMLTGATVAAGGTGYSVGHVLYVTGGTATTSSRLRVATLSGSAVATVVIDRDGKYSVTPGTSGVATTATNSGTGCTLNLTWSSHSNYATNVPKAAGGAGRWIRLLDASGRISVKAFGAKGDTATDDTVAIQRAVDTAFPLFVPTGTFLCLKPITWDGGKLLDIRGVNKDGYNESTLQLQADTSNGEPFFHKYGRFMKPDGLYSFLNGFEVSVGQFPGIGEKVTIRDLEFRTTYGDYGSCFELTLAKNSLFHNVYFHHCFRGLTLGESVFDTTVSHCRFDGLFYNRFAWDGTTGGEANRDLAKRAWGIHASGHAYIYGSAMIGCGCGLRLVGVANIMNGARMETNNYGIICANTMFYMGATSVSKVSRCSIGGGVSLEANAVALLVEDITSTTIGGFAIQGSPAEGARPASEVGVWVIGMDGTSSIERFTVGGNFTRSGIINQTRYGFNYFSGSNSSGATYSQMNTIFGNTGTNRPGPRVIGYNTGDGAVTVFQDLMMYGINGLNLRDMVKARNLGDVVTPSTSATSVNITFPTAITHAMYSINTVTGVADGTSTLPAGTYYIATTIVSKQGETGINYGIATQHSHKTVTITAGQRIDITFFGGAPAWTKRRVYRSVENAPAGVFRRYWEIPNTQNSFSDTGSTAGSIVGMPPQNGDIVTCEEVDTNYQIVATASWATSVHVTNKATTGFTLNFSAAPAGGSVSWLLFRP